MRTRLNTRLAGLLWSTLTIVLTVFAQQNLHAQSRFAGPIWLRYSQFPNPAIDTALWVSAVKIFLLTSSTAGGYSQGEEAQIEDNLGVDETKIQESKYIW